MPMTWFAHQVPVLGVKRARPRWFDATAMCIGSMMPDASYSFSAYLHTDHHRWPAAYSYGVPLTVAVAMVTRHLVAPRVAPVLPDLGSFRLRSYAVIADRRPSLAVTVMSAVLGIWSHIALDWFTHEERPGPRWLGYDDVVVRIGGRAEHLASVLQLVGHTVGTALGLWLLWRIGRNRLLDDWYGADAVAARRSVVATRFDRAVVAASVVGGALAGTAWAWDGERVERLQRPPVAVFGALVVAALLVGVRSGARAVAPELATAGPTQPTR